MKNQQIPFDGRNARRFIAVPLDEKASPEDAFSHPERFHIVEVSYDIALIIGESAFAKKAFETIDNYPIEPFEDPFFASEDVESLLVCMKEWCPEKGSEEAKVFELAEGLLWEAQRRGVGIYFKF